MEENKIILDSTNETEKVATELNASTENVQETVPENSVVEATRHEAATVPQVEKKKPVKAIIIAAVAAIGALFVMIAGIISVALIINANSVDSVVADDYEVTLFVDDEYTIKYTVTPEKAANKKVKWEVIPTGVVSVDEEGNVTALAEGKAQVVIHVGNKMDVVDIIVKDGPDFQKIYDEYCESDFAKIASDGSYLTIDTNPDNIDDYTNYTAYYTIISVNEALGLPESLMEKMGKTRALDGTQSQEFEDIRVTWSYHPDNGLNVTYEAIN
ncbi:MAG: Ig-like domain-containing protein [Clostridia bacterium]|nr:Ig-like domain-containing protein [Clostridia bacterium]